MAAADRLSPVRQAVNALGRVLLRAGLGPPRTYLLTAPGRRTGQPRPTPVTLVPITRPFFDAGSDAPLGAFVVEAPRHPVSRIMPGSAASESTRATPGRSA